PIAGAARRRAGALSLVDALVARGFGAACATEPSCRSSVPAVALGAGPECTRPWQPVAHAAAGFSAPVRDAVLVISGGKSAGVVAGFRVAASARSMPRTASTRGSAISARRGALRGRGPSPALDRVEVRRGEALATAEVEPVSGRQRVQDDPADHQR